MLEKKGPLCLLLLPSSQSFVAEAPTKLSAASPLDTYPDDVAGVIAEVGNRFLVGVTAHSA